jgi:Asp-tRNA(Asn)/Glu-tRNA(Gln) amidotransferase A subunit family amidase
MNMETRQGLACEYNEHRAEISPVLLERLDWAGGFPPDRLDEARRAAAEARAAFESATAGFDAILTPSAPGEAPEGLHYTGDATFNLLWTTLWGPCVTVPAGSGPNGMPLGVQIAGRIGADAGTLGIARWVQSACG